MVLFYLSEALQLTMMFSFEKHLLSLSTWELLHISYFSFAEIEWLILQSLGNLVIFFFFNMGPVLRFGTWIFINKRDIYRVVL